MGTEYVPWDITQNFVVDACETSQFTTNSTLICRVTLLCYNCKEAPIPIQHICEAPSKKTPTLASMLHSATSLSILPSLHTSFCCRTLLGLKYAWREMSEDWPIPFLKLSTIRVCWSASYIRSSCDTYIPRRRGCQSSRTRRCSTCSIPPSLCRRISTWCLCRLCAVWVTLR